tara:strand:- start:6432 stop:6758 length:327 start_codon:yes stop_codon:yes gene_type:complete
MKIKLHTNVRANQGYCKKGTIIEFDDKDAKSLISRGFATEVKESKKETPVIAESKQVEEPKKAEKVEEKVPKAKTESKKATKPSTNKKTSAKTPAKAKTNKASAKKAN